MIGTGHQHFGTEGLAGFEDAGVVGGDDHTAGTALAGLLPHMLHHWLAGNQQQRFAWQAGGAQPGGDYYRKFQAHLSRRSSSVRVRASLSSMTGIPSRIG
ncbi:hypothetical protein D3C76_1519890 [compost metagenome]